jgi:hypothetical protein
VKGFRLGIPWRHAGLAQAPDMRTPLVLSVKAGRRGYLCLSVLLKVTDIPEPCHPTIVVSK